MINPHLKHFFDSTKHSLAGLASAWRSEYAFRHEVFVFCILILVLCFTNTSLSKCLLVLGAWIFVMLIELLNAAIEEAFDLVTKEHNLHVKRGKDMASAAIFMALIINVFVWIDVFFLNS